MPRDLFGDVTRPSISIGNRKWYTVPVSLLSHSAIVLAVVVIPLFATEVLPKPWEQIQAYIDIVPVPPPLPPDPIQTNDKLDPPSDPNIPPVVAPTGFAPERPHLDLSWQDDKRVGTILGQGGFDADLVAPPTPPPVPQKPIRVSGAKAAQKIKEVAPVYPAFALAARVQGTVIIEATISAEGQVVDARILRSVPLLDQAALDAVRQWEYRPTLLNGVPVPVIMTVTVTFTLSR